MKTPNVFDLQNELAELRRTVQSIERAVETLLPALKTEVRSPELSRHIPMLAAMGLINTPTQHEAIVAALKLHGPDKIRAAVQSLSERPAGGPIWISNVVEMVLAQNRAAKAAEPKVEKPRGKIDHMASASRLVHLVNTRQVVATGSEKQRLDILRGYVVAEDEAEVRARLDELLIDCPWLSDHLLFEAAQ
jgi:hypothetical protein